MAMFQAKQEGRNTYRFFTEEIHTKAQERTTLEHDLHRALENNEMILHYQPIINIGTGKLSHLEALIRWQHPDRGMVPPDQFIPLAEESGLIYAINHWLIQTVGKQCHEWNKESFLFCCVNLNLGTFNNRHGLTQNDVEQMLKTNNLSAGQIAFEITETAMMENTKEAIDWMNSMKQIGIKLVIDDFGTGYSSLAYLKRFPVDCVKIDKEFICHMETNEEDLILVKTICAMAGSLGLTTVAEGVETQEQLELLAKIEPKCDFLQGYFVSKPLLPNALQEFIKEKAGNFLGCTQA